MKCTYRMIVQKILNKETILYLVFGVGTTMVNFLSFALSQKVLGEDRYLLSNIFSFIMATGFAYITNKQWVFESKEWSLSICLKEAVTFVSTRISTFFFIEELGLLFFVKILKVNKLTVLQINGIMIAKIILAFVAVLANYVLSKWYVFNRRRRNG